MLALLVVAAVAPMPFAFVAPIHSTARTALAWSIFYWSVPMLASAWLAWTNYAFSVQVDGPQLRIFTLRGWRAIDLRRLTRMHSFSLWGQFGAAHGFRLHTDDGQHAMVVVASQLTALNRRNVERARAVRAALVPYAAAADERGRAWLGAGPPPSHLAAARHVIAMMFVYFVCIVVALLVVAGFIALALH